jgi:hypothetical protein
MFIILIIILLLIFSFRKRSEKIVYFSLILLIKVGYANVCSVCKHVTSKPKRLHQINK